MIRRVINIVEFARLPAGHSLSAKFDGHDYVT
jgi:hypothetical protein